MKNKAAIIIVNWNGRKFLNDCLKAVFKQNYNNFDVYFIDNGSRDGSSKFVQKNFPKVNIVQLSKNTGFARGNNEGIKKAFEDKEVGYIICLNNDTIVDRNWLRGLVGAVDYKKKIDMVSSMALLPNGKVQALGIKFEKNLIGNGVGGLAIGYGESPNKYKKPMEIFCPNGASCLFTRRLLEKVGLFDEDFFAYAEDLDLGMRARKVGFKCLFTPHSKLIHLHSQTSGGSASPFKAYLIKRNIYFVAIKNFSLVDMLMFPIREIFWNIKNVFNKDSKISTNKLKNKVGFLVVIKIMTRVYLSVFVMMPKMVLKRLKMLKN